MPNHSQRVACAIIIPAYNEEHSIAGTLHKLTKGIRRGEFEITVICNGCSDRTAEVARAACPEAHVLETPVASKTAALNMGLAAAGTTPLVFLDADIKTSATAVRRLVHEITKSGCDLAYGKAEFNVAQCSAPVQKFYQAWQLNPYFDGGKVGGFFAVSKAGLDRLGLFPILTNDDEFVRRKLFANAIYARLATYTVEPPRTLLSLIKVRSRVYRGNRELSSQGIQAAANQKYGNASRFFRRLASRPNVWLGACVFALVAACAHARNRLLLGPVHWEQDQTARMAQG